MLRDLRLAGSEPVLAALPNFDFYLLGHVRKLSLSAREDEPHVFDLEMVALYNDAGRECCVTIMFIEVRMAKVPELGPSFYLAEMEVEDVASAQMEGVRYRARCYGSPPFEVLCRDVRISM
jgi:hypothetical protein